MVKSYLCIQRSKFYSQSYTASFEPTLYQIHAVTDNAQCLYLITQSRKTIARIYIKQYQQTSIYVNKFMKTEF